MFAEPDLHAARPIAKGLLTFARAIDASCARMNRGLAAVAIYLAVLVVGMAVIRAEEY
jgi:hypothetical protein